jgi:hypothetical protein
MGTGSFPGVASGQGVTLIPHPLLVLRSENKSSAIPLLYLRAFVACEKGETYLQNIALFRLSSVDGTSRFYVRGRILGINDECPLISTLSE